MTSKVDSMAPSAPAAPWEVGPQPVYHNNAVQALWGLEFSESDALPQAPPNSCASDVEREKQLREWGRRREENMHRPPLWCMDQLISGSGLFPPRLLADEWFNSAELSKIQRLEQLLAPTGRAQHLARDVMALKMYNVDVRIIVDDSGSMGLSMFGNDGFGRSGYGGWTRSDITRVFGDRAFRPDNAYVFESCPMSPNRSRWEFAQDALRQWESVFNILEVQPKYYLLNRQSTSMFSRSNSGYQSCSQIFSSGPCGGTPMGRTLDRVLQDIKASDPFNQQTHLILALTDGEASDKVLFNQRLDQIQDELYGDVQVCLLGLSLEPADIAWFEDEECDDTRIRTIEPWEVEQQQMLWRQVIGNPCDYNFAMHTMRALVTNLFPADYDCEAPLQTLRHRLYITLHAVDRRATGRRDAVYKAPSQLDCGCLSGIFGAQLQRPPRLQEEEMEGVLSDPRLADLVSSARPRGLAPGDYRSPARTFLPSRTLTELQKAIGYLQPGEFNSRDLQYSNLTQNSQACRNALQHLFLAAGMDPMQ